MTRSWLRPMLELIEDARTSFDELMSEAAPGFVEQLLVLWAQEVAGAKHPGRCEREVRWHGSQTGRVVLAERTLALGRPRLRRRSAGGKEVSIPVYERLQAEPRLGARIRDILVRGVSTRKCAEVLPRMAGTVGIAKSSVSRRFASRAGLAAATLLYLRGNDGNLGLEVERLYALHRYGLSIVAIEYRGYGRSSGPAPSEAQV